MPLFFIGSSASSASSAVKWIRATRGAGCGAIGLALLLNLPVHAQQAPWMLGPFKKPAGVNPIIAPSGAAKVRSVVSDSVVAWEGFATFNPAAVVRAGKVYALYRAEDATGDTT